MPKSKIVSSIIALVLGLCVVVFTIAYFSINGKHNREGYTFEGDFFQWHCNINWNGKSESNVQ